MLLRISILFTIMASESLYEIITERITDLKDAEPLMFIPEVDIVVENFKLFKNYSDVSKFDKRISIIEHYPGVLTRENFREIYAKRLVTAEYFDTNFDDKRIPHAHTDTMFACDRAAKAANFLIRKDKIEKYEWIYRAMVLREDGYRIAVIDNKIDEAFCSSVFAYEKSKTLLKAIKDRKVRNKLKIKEKELNILSIDYKNDMIDFSKDISTRVNTKILDLYQELLEEEPN